MKVLMVCLGNICRSPLAQGILEKKIKEHDLLWKVDSCGTSGWHQGELPDQRSIDVATKNGIDLSGQRSRKIIESDFADFDVILAMDAQNYNNIMAMTKKDSDKSKIRMILNYSYPKENRKVPDPYYEGGFDYVFDLLDNACEQMIREHIY